MSNGELEDVADRSNSKNKREKLKKAFDNKCEALIKNKLYPALNKSIQKELLKTDCHGTLSIDSKDKHALVFTYVPVEKIDSYVKQHVFIELGWRSDHHPEEIKIIKPYISDLLEKSEEFNVSVKVLDWRRTFWEKVTVFHRLSMLKENKTTSKNISRHYYDIYKLLKHKPLKYWMGDGSILKDVLEFNDLCAEQNHFRYNDILKDGLKVIPSDNIIEELRNDYRDTLIMIYEDPKPTFEEIIRVFEQFQVEFNKYLKQ